MIESVSSAHWELYIEKILRIDHEYLSLNWKELIWGVLHQIVNCTNTLNGRYSHLILPAESTSEFWHITSVFLVTELWCNESNSVLWYLNNSNAIYFIRYEISVNASPCYNGTFMLSWKYFYRTVICMRPSTFNLCTIISSGNFIKEFLFIFCHEIIHGYFPL